MNNDLNKLQMALSLNKNQMTMCIQ